MTKEVALKQFFDSFGIPAYPSSSVPDDVIMPYMTYDMVTGYWLGGEVSITVNLWYYTMGESPPNEMAQKISDTIGMGGKIIPCDGGAIWLKRGSPWCQSLQDETDPIIKRRYINVTAEYLTEN